MRRWRKSTKLLGLTSYELREYMIFFQIEKLTVCKEGFIKFKVINCSYNVIFFSNYEWHNKEFLFIKHLDIHWSSKSLGTEIYPVQRLSSKPNNYLKTPPLIFLNLRGLCFVEIAVA